MARKIKTKSVGRWSDPITHQHRRMKVDYRRLAVYVLTTAGNELYYIGAMAERVNRNFWRHVRHALRAFFNVLGIIFGTVFGLLFKLIGEFFKDLVSPFVKLVESIYSYTVVMSDPRARDPRFRAARRKQFFRYGWLWNRHLIGRMLNNVMPLTAFAVCAYVIYTVVNLNYVLAVNYNGQTLGYVPTEQVYDSAQRILQNRIVYGENSGSWKADATLQIAVVTPSEVSTEDTMADSLLTVSGAEIAKATGLYVGGTFYGATTATELLSSAVDSIIQPYKDAVAAQSNTDVRFTREVELIDGIYPENSILTFDEIEKVVKSTTENNIYYTARAGETALGIADKNGISLDELQALNPSADLNISDGENLLVAQNEPLLSVKTITVETVRETVDFELVKILDTRFPVSWSRIIIPGQNGSKDVTYEIEMRDGEEISRSVISEQILVEPVAQEMIVGAKTNVGGTIIGSGRLAWPTGPYQRISRGYSSSHFGIDIAAVMGTDVYAADSGTVTTSGWTNSGYGYYVIIDHGGGFETVYGHCSQLVAKVGDVVPRGQLIAYVGSTGNSTGPHLHFEVRVDGKRVATESYLYG